MNFKNNTKFINNYKGYHKFRDSLIVLYVLVIPSRILGEILILPTGNKLLQATIVGKLSEEFRNSLHSCSGTCFYKLQIFRKYYVRIKKIVHVRKEQIKINKRACSSFRFVISVFDGNIRVSFMETYLFITSSFILRCKEPSFGVIFIVISADTNGRLECRTVSACT